MSDAIRVIKKYPNRRLYDTDTSSYITLADVKRLALACVKFRVEDAKTREDLTRSILLQIIVEQESAGTPLFSSETLLHIIRFYADPLHSALDGQFEKSIRTFVERRNECRAAAPAEPNGANDAINVPVEVPASATPVLIPQAALGAASTPETKAGLPIEDETGGKTAA
jgi:polyhydroxyalkanoate synthesis repressor PhaR